MTAQPPIRVAIIGAGAAGMAAAARCLQMPADRIIVTVLEKGETFGGCWSHRENMYDSLRTNLPCELMRFDDLPFESSSSRSFVTLHQVGEYLERYAEAHGIRKFTRFGCTVENVSRRQSAPEFEVTYSDESSRRRSEMFDSVVVASGHFNDELIPSSLLDQANRWRGRILHSKHYRKPGAYKDQTVMVVGAKSSGTDIAHDISGEAAAVFVADRYCLDSKGSVLDANAEFIPQNLTWAKGLAELVPESNSVLMEDGEQIDNIDAIIFATGYLYRFPFLDDTCNSPIVDGKFLKLAYQQGEKGWKTRFFLYGERVQKLDNELSLYF